MDITFSIEINLTILVYLLFEFCIYVIATSPKILEFRAILIVTSVSNLYLYITIKVKVSNNLVLVW